MLQLSLSVRGKYDRAYFASLFRQKRQSLIYFQFCEYRQLSEFFGCFIEASYKIRRKMKFAEVNKIELAAFMSMPEDKNRDNRSKISRG